LLHTVYFDNIERVRTGQNQHRFRTHPRWYISIMTVSLCDMPSDVSWLILEYLDVPSILNLSQVSSTKTSQADSLVRQCSNDELWAHLVQRRFAIDATKPYQRPSSYGGSNWKTAYRLLSRCNKMPRSRQFQRKVIFARSGSGLSWPSSASTNTRTRNQRRCHANDTSVAGVCCWVLVGHTDDCRLRRQPNQLNENMTPREEVYVELQVCLQLVSSCTIQADLNLSEANVQLLGEPPCKKNVVLFGPRKPRVIHHSFGGKLQDVLLDIEPTTTCGSNENDLILSIKPLEFVVVALNIICPHDMVYETDFLSRAISLHIPVCLVKELPIRSTIATLPASNSTPMESPPDVLSIDLYRQYIDSSRGQKEDEFTDCTLSDPPLLESCDDTPSEPFKTSLKWIKVLEPGYINASFLKEKEFWNHYIELPGHCLALTSTVHSNLP
jgi:hypothetical protein